MYQKRVLLILDDLKIKKERENEVCLAHVKNTLVLIGDSFYQCKIVNEQSTTNFRYPFKMKGE